MALTLEQCETESLLLTQRERALLAEQLLESLDDADSTRFDHQWAIEADKRYCSYQNGTSTTRPSDLVVQEARAKFL